MNGTYEYALPPGTEYVHIGGKALALSGLAGHRRGSIFYPAGSEMGYLIRVRRETARELAERVRAHALAHPAPSAALDINDWK